MRKENENKPIFYRLRYREGKNNNPNTVLDFFKPFFNLGFHFFFLNIRRSRSEINPSVYCEIIETNNLQGNYAVAQIVFSQTSELCCALLAVCTVYRFIFFFCRSSKKIYPVLGKTLSKLNTNSLISYGRSEKLRSVHIL